MPYKLSYYYYYYYYYYYCYYYYYFNVLGSKVLKRKEIKTKNLAKLDVRIVDSNENAKLRCSAAEP